MRLWSETTTCRHRNLNNNGYRHGNRSLLFLPPIICLPHILCLLFTAPARSTKILFCGSSKKIRMVRQATTTSQSGKEIMTFRLRKCLFVTNVFPNTFFFISVHRIRELHRLVLPPVMETPTPPMHCIATPSNNPKAPAPSAVDPPTLLDVTSMELPKTTIITATPMPPCKEATTPVPWVQVALTPTTPLPIAPPPLKKKRRSKPP